MSMPTIKEHVSPSLEAAGSWKNSPSDKVRGKSNLSSGAGDTSMSPTFKATATPHPLVRSQSANDRIKAMQRAFEISLETHLSLETMFDDMALEFQATKAQLQATHADMDALIAEKGVLEAGHQDMEDKLAESRLAQATLEDECRSLRTEVQETNDMYRAEVGSLRTRLRSQANQPRQLSLENRALVEQNRALREEMARLTGKSTDRKGRSVAETLSKMKAVINNTTKSVEDLGRSYRRKD